MTGITLAILAAGLIGLAILVLVIAFVFGGDGKDRPLSVAEQLSSYGSSAQSGPATPEQVGIADQARLAVERGLATNTGLEERVSKRLDAAGMSIRPAEWLMMQSGITLFAIFAGFVLTRSLIIALLLGLVAFVCTWAYLKVKRGRRIAAFSAALGDTLQLIAGSLSAGLSLPQALDIIVREGVDPVSSEFKRAIVDTRLGVDLEDALNGVAIRMESKDFAWVVMAIRIQREVGGNLAELLLTVAQTLRERDYLRRHVKALSAEGRLSCYILGALPPGFLIYLLITQYDYVSPMFTDLRGWILIIAMVILEVVGLFWMTKVAKVEV